MNALFSLRVTDADLEALTKATTNRSSWIREAVQDLLDQPSKDRKELIETHGGHFGEGYTRFVPVIMPPDVAARVSDLAASMKIKLSQIVRAAVRRRLSNPTKTNGKRR